MADDNIDLQFLAEQGKRILGELAEARSERSEIRAEQENLARLVGKVSDAVTEIAKVQERHSELLGKIVEIQANQGARLNAIDGRLAIIEQHTGLVKA
jgi:chromosome segregation ATPase